MTGMTLPPAKRQKRLLVLGSDDDENWASPAEEAREVESATIEGAGAKATSEETSINRRSLPSRTRTKLTNNSSMVKRSSFMRAGLNPSPKKPARRSKSAAKPVTKQRSKPISSFFGAANRNQQATHLKRAERDAPKVETLEVEYEEEDVIEDDSPIEDADQLPEPQDTRHLVLDCPKITYASTRKIPVTAQIQKLPAKSHRFSIAGNATGKRKDLSVSAMTIPKDQESRPWADRFAPCNLEELAVHRKKVADVRNWLENAFNGRDRRRLLILRGPSGVGKTATISTLARAMNLEISEWRNPVDSEYLSEGYLSMSARFDEFLGRSGKFGTLLLTDSAGTEHAVPSSRTATTNGGLTRKRLILLEEFPNTVPSTSNALRSFRSSMLEYLAIKTLSMQAPNAKQTVPGNSITPVVLIITETRLTTTTAASDSFTAHRLLGSEILSHPAVTIIEYNPVASTYLVKALDLVVQKEARLSGRRRIPGSSALRKLAELGDIRSAVGSLEFFCLRGLDADVWGGGVTSRAQKGANASSALTRMESASLELITQRERSLGLFHAVGKVVYNKRDDFRSDELLPQPPDHISEHVRSRIPQVSADELFDETGTDTGTFVAALHENYVLSCEGSYFAEALQGCLNTFSDSDLLASPQASRFGSRQNLGGRSCQATASDSLRQDEICFQLVVRGLLFALPDPVKRSAHHVAWKSGAKNDTFKMFYPASARLSRQMEEIDDLVETWTNLFGNGARSSGRPLYSTDHHLITSKSQHFTALLADSDEHGATEPMRTSLSCTKAELILERLPYITKIEQCNGKSTRLKELENITQFNGVGAPVEEVSDEDTVGDVGLATEETIDHLAGSKSEDMASKAVVRQGTRRHGQDVMTIVIPVDEEIRRLYLSDDDIEDG